ncbi:hypothetical protein ACIQNI_32740 [Streptomyces sp. NPDC091266]|uniref:hypothetical protein n=1 Tax=Streptomyces sp. NPDC091266 TaxID=3365978 RepID=UPI0038307FF5
MTWLLAHAGAATLPQMAHSRGPDGGVSDPYRCRVTHTAASRSYGASLRGWEEVGQEMVQGRGLPPKRGSKSSPDSHADTPASLPGVAAPSAAGDFRV